MPTLTDQKSRIDEGYDEGKGSYNPRALSREEEYDRRLDEGLLKTTVADTAQEDANIEKAQVKLQEESPSQIKNNTSPPDKTKLGGSSLKNVILRRVAPSGLIALLAGGLITALLTMSPISLLVHIKEVAMENWDMSNTSFTKRLDKVLEKKIASDTNTGAGCAVTAGVQLPLRCKFQRPSNKMLKNFESAGISMVGGDDASVKRDGLWPNKVPTAYKYTDLDGTVKTVAAKDFVKAYRSSPILRSKLYTAYSPKYTRFADSVFKKLMGLFHLNKKDSTNGVKDEKTAKAAVNEAVEEGDPLAQKVAQKAGKAGATDAAETVTDDIVDAAVKKEATSALKTIASKMSGGGAITGVLSTICTLTKAPNIMVKVVRGYQIMLLIKFAMPFLKLADHLKAGTQSSDPPPTPEQVSSVASLLAIGTTKSKSGIESTGMRNLLMKDTAISKTDSAKKLVPGMSIVDSPLGAAAGFTSSPAVTTACNIATDEKTGLAIDAATSETLVVPVLNFIIGKVVGMATDAFLNTDIAKGLINQAVNFAKPLFTPVKEFLYSLIGDMTANLSTEDTGTGVAFGIEQLLSQESANGVNGALLKTQVGGYMKATNEVNLAYAEIDRATLSPFDTSSPNTFLGSIISQMIPYYNNFSSMSGILSSFGSMASSSFGSLVGIHNAGAEDPALQWNGCEDPSLNGIAAGMSCNIGNGIPAEYLGKDDLAVFDELTAKNEIDQTTGDPVPNSELDKWVNRCTPGESDAASSCTITDNETANYALYSNDNRWRKDLDGEDSSATTAASTTPVDTSGAVGPATLSEAQGAWGGYTNGNLPSSALASSGLFGGSCSLHPSALAAFTALSAEYKKQFGKDLTMNDCYRDYAHQVQVYNDWCAKGDCGKAAKPDTVNHVGTSNHGWGLAMDISGMAYGNASYVWMMANAPKFGIVNPPWAIEGGTNPEAWHWEYARPV